MFSAPRPLSNWAANHAYGRPLDVAHCCARLALTVLSMLSFGYLLWLYLQFTELSFFMSHLVLIPFNTILFQLLHFSSLEFPFGSLFYIFHTFHFFPHYARMLHDILEHSGRIYNFYAFMFVCDNSSITAISGSVSIG